MTTPPADNLEELREMALREVLRMFHGDQDETNRWLDSPCLGLGHKTPNKCLETREGIDQVRTLVGRLQHGIIT
jgi:uncharacterized protein (DUF2384 family)